MGWIPKKDEILNEVQNYGELSFFKKSKNTLVIFVVVVSALTIVLMRGQEGYFTSSAFYEAAFSLFLAIFIFLNHRWAMLTFAAIYIFGRITFITYAIMLNSRLPFSAIIFGAVAAVLTYSAYKVATELKRAKLKSVADNNNEISTNSPSPSRSYFTPPRVDFSVLFRDRKFITALYIFSICAPLALSGEFLIFLFSSIYSILILIIFGVIFVKWRLFYTVITFPVLSAFLMWFVFGSSLSITIFSPFRLVLSFVLLFEIYM